MFHALLEKLKPKSRLEKKAEHLWSEGYLIHNWERPKLGMHWPDDILPFWRAWSETMHSEKAPYWTNIHDDIFWEKLCPQLSSENQRLVLLDGGQRGNICILKHSSVPALQAYAAEVLREASSQNGILHPKTMEWMLYNSYWDTNDIHTLIMAYDCKHSDSTSIQQIERACNKNFYTDEFLQHWYLPLFRDFQINANQQATIIANIIFTMDIPTWEETIQPFCAPYLHADVDIALLYSTYGAQKGEMVEPNPSLELLKLHDDIRRISQYNRSSWNSTLPSVAVDISNIQPILSLLIDLQPIEKPMDLYRHAKRVKDHILGTSPKEPLIIGHFDFS